MTGERSIIIIGGGASGVLLAAHLLRDGGMGVRVTVIERRGEFGVGLAYSAMQRDHKVNVPARNMSAFADQPDHFRAWLVSRGYDPGPDGWWFAPRRLYGSYLGSLLEEVGRAARGRLLIVNGEAMAVRETERGISTHLTDGRVLEADLAVLALGHETQPARSKGLAVRAGSPQDTPIDPDDPVIILGSGLSMVDAWLSLAAAGHRGDILVVSRNGLLPQAHHDVPPLQFAAETVPTGKSIVTFLRWFRGQLDATIERGGDWRSVVDALRPHSQSIWQNWSERSRRQFLAHARPLWNVHRHRLPPELHDRMTAAIASGQMELIAGYFLDIAKADKGVVATIRRRGSKTTERIAVSRVYDCGGVSVDVAASSNPVLHDLVSSGRARPDPLRIGLDVSQDCAVSDAAGKTSSRLFAIGPLTRGRLWEIEAIPDIRIQAAELAAKLRA
ncbi:FAD/NAD(P)-binding protein [Devosia albogilva]|uniref:FAD/NAD(P)-binding protein n=1 Tax=Devosia albogilva TaxID=429726 RepID=A0ABW5QM88_9HYPH